LSDAAIQHERERVDAINRRYEPLWAMLKEYGIEPWEWGAFVTWRDRRDGDGQRQPKPDLFSTITSFRERQLAEIPPRTWYVEGMVTPGFNMIVGKKSQGKSFLMMQLANAIAAGAEILGRATTPTKVLYVAFELDEGDTSDRFKGMAPLAEDAYVLHTWSTGDKALADAERAITEHGFNVLMFDTFLPLLPKDPDFKLNEYGDSEIYLRWRQLGKKHGAAIVASWHTGKNDREDFFLNPIGSTGMVAQADSLITIDRKRGDLAGKLFVGGNHVKDTAISILFEDGLFKLGEGEISMDRLTPDQEKTLTVLAQHPEGCTPTAVGLATGRNNNAARAALNRLIARGKVMKPARGVYALVTL